MQSKLLSRRIATENFVLGEAFLSIFEEHTALKKDLLQQSCFILLGLVQQLRGGALHTERGLRDVKVLNGIGKERRRKEKKANRYEQTPSSRWTTERKDMECSKKKRDLFLSCLYNKARRVGEKRGLGGERQWIWVQPEVWDICISSFSVPLSFLFSFFCLFSFLSFFFYLFSFFLFFLFLIS